MTRAINFSAGPATLPLPVLEYAHNEFLDHEGTGMSLIEHSHRGAAYAKVHEEAKSLIRELMNVPDTHEILFMQGGASAQFALAPMNLRGDGQSADYINTGAWSDKAMAEALITGAAREAGTGKVDGKYTRVPKQAELELDPSAAYTHFTSNNTIMGTQFHQFPDSGDVPLVADMSSDILWRPIDVSKFGLIYAGAQKNIGPAGLTVVIVRSDLVGDVLDCTPSMFNYQSHADNGSMLNTPPTFAWYLAGLVFEWIGEQGGLAAMAEVNQRKAGKLYEVIDRSDFYSSPVDPRYRSWMNVPFILADESLDAEFLSQAGDAGLLNLKGHRSVGGMRASIYNAMPEAGISTLTEFMAEFERSRG